jgi:hypothetical protein
MIQAVIVWIGVACCISSVIVLVRMYRRACCELRELLDEARDLRRASTNELWSARWDRARTPVEGPKR